MGQGLVHAGQQAVERDDGLIVRGYLHGSANQAVVRMLAEIGDKKADNILLRPLLKYVRPMDLPYIPIGERK